MNAVKGKLLKKLKTIKTIGYLKPENILQHVQSRAPLMPIQAQPEKPKKILETKVKEETETIDVSELMRDLEDAEMENLDKENMGPNLSSLKPKIESFGDERGLEGAEMGNLDLSSFKPKIESLGDKNLDLSSLKPKIESFGDERGLEGAEMRNLDLSPLKPKIESFGDQRGLEDAEMGNLDLSSVKPKIESFGDQRLSEIDVSSFRRPDLDSCTLFDPNLLAAFKQAVMVVKAQEAERMAMIEETIEQIIKQEEQETQEPPSKSRKIEESTTNALQEFPQKCPPGGSDSVILYTTGLRGIRKTFEDCQRIRFLLENFRVLYFERDVSMHTEYKEELWKVLEGRVLPPRLFIKGRYIGGAEEVLALHEQGKFKPLFEGIPIDDSQGYCDGCGGVRFVMCFRCNGSTKILDDDNDNGKTMKCLACNENGLIVCPLCSLS